MKKGHLILLISLLLPILPSCGKTTSVSISYDGLSKQCQFSIDKIKESLSTRNYKVVDLKADYQVVFHDIDINLGEQSYSVSVDDNTINNSIIVILIQSLYFKKDYGYHIIHFDLMV